MATESALDLNVTAAGFAEAYALHLQAKRNRTTQAVANARTRAVAQWGDLVDDFMLAAQSKLRLDYAGTGSPEGVVTAPIGSTYKRTDGGAATTFYVKESGAGNTGWVAYGTPTDPVLYELDFGTLATVALTGTQTLDGRDWISTPGAGATQYRMLNGSGLQFDANTTSTSFNGSSQTGPRTEITWSELVGATFDPSRRYRLDFRIGLQTLGTSSNAFAVGIVPGASGFSNMALGQKLNSGGNVIMRHLGAGSSTVALSTGVSATFDVITLIVESNIVRTFGAVWGGSWPEMSAMTLCGGSLGPVTQNADLDNFLNPASRIVMGFGPGETGGAMEAIVRSIRVSRLAA